LARYVWFASNAADRPGHFERPGPMSPNRRHRQHKNSLHTASGNSLANHVRLQLDGFEPRLAPASGLTFTAVDRDHVTITATAGNQARRASFANVGYAYQLHALDLTDPPIQGASLSTAVARPGTGHGLVNIGRINSTGRNLGSARVTGDLAKIDAGTGAGA